jgi:hypothetical protein
MSTAGPIDEAWVLAASRGVNLSLAPEQVAGVTANLARIETVAHSLDAVALEAHDELAPVWTP